MKNLLMSAAVGDIAGSTTALTIFHLKNGKDKDFVREHLLNEYYPDWADKSYADIHDDYTFYSTCPGTVGPMAYAYYKKMPDALVFQALKKLPGWMVNVNDRFDELCNL